MPHHSPKGWVVSVGLLGLLSVGVGLTTLGPGPAAPAVVGAPVVSAPARTPAKADEVRYGRDIRPILSDRCFQCHGFDPATRMADLRLDVRDMALAPRKGNPAIVPGDPDKSELIRRIFSTDAAVVMPPSDSHKAALNAEQRDLLRRWIAEGANYEAHWAFVPPARPEAPDVKSESWARNPIDRFILARLERQGLAPSPEADKVSLLRRLFLDLTGLPPTPDEIDAFMADARPDAYEHWVDKVMTEEPYRSRYAERMTVPWLDQSRFADTCGIHMDAGRQMWLWRDWVLQAFRENMPYDRFVTEQLAGDLIPDATVSQKIASGFNRNHVTTDEGGAIAEEYLVEYAVDRVSTTGSVFMGLTLGCARCHDHKFDPVTQEDFYSFYAFFNSIEEPGLYSQTPDVNRAYEPFLLVPTAKQNARLAEIKTKTDELRKEFDLRTPEEEQQRAGFMRDLWERTGVSWPAVTVAAATATEATLEPQPDGSVRASGTNPDRDDFTVTLRTDGVNLRLIALEALNEPSAFKGGLGRADNANVVVTGLTAEAISVADPSKTQPVKLIWAWADVSQENGDFDVTNLLLDDTRGWALGVHLRKGPRTALLLAEAPFGFEGGTDVRITVKHQSVYPRHTLARFRLSLGAINDAGLDLLPTASGRWYATGAFSGDDQNRVYEPVFGPEEGDLIDPSREYSDKKIKWAFQENFADAQVNATPAGRVVTYVGKHVYAPSPRQIPLSLGSDDGFMIFSNGKEFAQNKTDRGAAPDQDKATLPLVTGRNAVVMKIVNTGGPGGSYYRADETTDLSGDMVAALLPTDRQSPEVASRLDAAWRMAFVPRYRETREKILALEKEVADINSKVPQTMVMKELPMPRETFILSRGVYDKPDKTRPVSRRVPTFLGTLPEGSPTNRLGLAQWMTSAQNPLLARVTVNRLWEQFFGAGIVRTVEDFGLQGEWPTHPELLDWLAVEFREGAAAGEPAAAAWDLQHIVRLIVTSSTYRQSSAVRPELREIDPDNRLVGAYPRRRLSAEQIRDQALYVAGLLVEEFGGPSVKPYQPEGLWQEVAMPQSNTRAYQRGMGNDLWRRSMYTYWKRAVPPPTMLTFDAPTRESCTTRRIITSTPLQALALWNDEQFLEAARVLAQRTLAEPGDEQQRLTSLFRRCVARAPDAHELATLHKALIAFKERYTVAPADADGVLKAGIAPRPGDVPPPELAAWTMLASAALNLYETTTQE